MRASATYKVTLVNKAKGSEVTIDVPDDKFILEAGLDAGVDLPYSCSSGTCSTCVGIVQSGKVEQEDQQTLDEDQLNLGYVLTCVAYPRSDLTISTNEQENMF